ncbi:MAG: hypothetical protein IJZ30_04660 [Alphaproteobacteria bacterium]|nr:hypothetical protein [Alphaproteobacteria bacterium]
MIRLFYTFVLFILFSAFNVNAYEFVKIDELYNVLEKNHSHSANLRKISFKGFDFINQLDKNFRLYNSDTKAYLYHQNNLVKSFALPQQNNHNSWKNILTDVLKIYADQSNKFQGNEKLLEDKILSVLAKNIDSYSRIENTKNEEANLIFDVFNNVIYIKSNTFYKGFSDDVKKIVYNNNLAEGIIFDLRHNIGGDFNEAIKLSDLFLDDTLIAYSKEQNETNYYTSTKGDIFNNKKIIILTSNKTASAAEVVTASLSDQSRAVVIGTKTYGKGSLQSVYNMNDQRLYVTSGLIYSPSGKIIDKNGITPQICTGIDNSCVISSKEDTSKDILLAIDLIKNNLG